MSDSSIDYIINSDRKKYKRLVSQVSQAFGSKVKVTRPIEKFFLDKTNEFRKRLNNGETIDDIMVEALAVCREATRIVQGKRHYDVQIEAAIAMQNNNIVEMKTGEGKSLVQILSAYLNALEATKSPNRNEWKSVHVLTSNDYLARRDQLDNKGVFDLLGLSSSYAMSNEVIQKSSNKKQLQDQKREAYKCDIVYSTAKTVAFDYLSDNTIMLPKNKYLTKPLHRAIVDEADDILLDQATTPLILSKGSSDSSTKEVEEDVYLWATKYINGEGRYNNEPIPCQTFYQAQRDKYEKWKGSAVFLDTHLVTLSSVIKDEIAANIQKEIRNDPSKSKKDAIYLQVLRENAVEKCLLAKYAFMANKQYQVRNNRVMLVDAGGRVMPNSKYRDGMQEAIEYKEDYELSKKTNGREHIVFTKQNFTSAKCTYPDFFRIYEDGICGMTGTSDRKEFNEIYGLETYKVDSRLPNIRVDEEDEVYATKKAKYKAIIKDVLECQKTGQPVLIGTLNVNESNEICKELEKIGIRFQRLDAKHADNMEKEASVISTAGLLGSVTVATNMAGRGTDIKLGPGVREVGGLYVIGSSKNKNIRIDNQLKGRAGRQGDPGRCKYFASLEDELVEIRNRSSLFNFFKRKFQNSDKKITNKKVIKMINECQLNESGIAKQNRKISEKREAQAFTPFKKIMYEEREKVFNADLKEYIQLIYGIVDSYVKKVFENGSDYENVSARLYGIIDIDENSYEPNSEKIAQSIKNKISHQLSSTQKAEEFFETNRIKTLKAINDYWVFYIEQLEDLGKRLSILQYSAGYNENTYRFEAGRLFEEMIENLQSEIVAYAANGSLEYGMYEREEFIKDNGAVL